MAHQATPSRRKFRIAKEFARALAVDLGKGLKAVFVVGSVAANMATPDTDIDIVAVCDNAGRDPRYPKAGKVYSRQRLDKKNQIHFFWVDTKTFEDPGNDWLVRRWPAGDALREMALPIFGDKEYLQKFAGKSYNLPNRERVLGKYVLLKPEFGPRDSLPQYERVKFKRSVKGRKRFLPR